MVKLTKILESVLGELNVPKPEDAYKFDSVTKKDLGYGIIYRYVYTNYEDQIMEVTVMSTKLAKEPGQTLYIAFGLHDPDTADNEYDTDEEEERKYKSQTGANDMLKVLATVVNAVNQTAKKIGGIDKVYALSYNASDKRRKNIYDHYIQSLFPGFKKSSDPSSSNFTRFINTNFKGK